MSVCVCLLLFMYVYACEYLCMTISGCMHGFVCVCVYVRLSACLNCANVSVNIFLSEFPPWVSNAVKECRKRKCGVEQLGKQLLLKATRFYYNFV